MKLYYFFPSTRLCSSSPRHTFLALASLSLLFFCCLFHFLRLALWGLFVTSWNCCFCTVELGLCWLSRTWRHGFTIFTRPNQRWWCAHERDRVNERRGESWAEKLARDWAREVREKEREENCWEKSKASYILITSILRYYIDVMRIFL